MKIVTLAEAQAQLSSLIEMVEAGEEITVTRDGLPVALMVVPRPLNQQLPSLVEFRAQQPWQSKSAGDLIRRLRDTDRY